MQKAQKDTLELLMVAGKNFGEDATAAVKVASKEATSASKTTAAK